MKHSVKTLFVAGMSCGLCENKIRKALGAVPGVLQADADSSTGKVTITVADPGPETDGLREAIEKAGYTLLSGRRARTSSFLGVGIGVVIVAVYLFIDALGGFTLLPGIDSSFSYGMLLLAGILTSFHCVAMCGGINLSQSVSAGGSADTASRLRPGLLYNTGRVISYTAIGAVVGLAGSVFDFSPKMKAVITAAAGLVMLFLGLRMLGILPRISLPRFPAFRMLSALFGGISKRGPFLVGIMNGFIPCGPLQTMQIYALGTGSALAGAFSMFLFSLGTVPVMLGFGITAALIPRRHTFHLVRAGAVLVIFLGFITIGRSAALGGWNVPSISDLASKQPEIRDERVVRGSPERSGEILKASLAGNIQTVITEIGPRNYVPFAVQAGVPVRWTIRARAEDLNGCNNPLIVPSLGLKIQLKPGDTIVEFTAGKEGIIPYSCWMAMIRSRITVLASLSDSPIQAPSRSLSFGPEDVGYPVIREGLQEITVDVTASGFIPPAFVLERGKRARFTFIPSALDDSTSFVVFPEYRGKLDLSKEELMTPILEITEDFTFSCFDGSRTVYVRVVDDLANINIDEIHARIRASTPQDPSASPAVSCCQ